MDYRVLLKYLIRYVPHLCERGFFGDEPRPLDEVYRELRHLFIAEANLCSTSPFLPTHTKMHLDYVIYWVKQPNTIPDSLRANALAEALYEVDKNLLRYFSTEGWIGAHPHFR